MKKWFINRYNGIIFGRTKIGEFFNATYSLRSFLKYSFSDRKLNEKENLKAFIIKQYHIVEKGLALPSPRENFGIPKIKLYENKYGYDYIISNPVRGCLKEYLEANPNLSNKDEKLKSSLVEFINTQKPEDKEIGGTKLYTLSDLELATNIDFKRFVESRSSVRDFKEEKVDRADINKAVAIARNAPSVCNRQSWRLHYYDNTELKNELLNLQHGSGGFIESIQGLFIVTTDIRGFTKMEQNEVYVDGGIISMNLVLALHSLGIGSCCLNTCFPYTREKKVKVVGNIDKNERLIMMIGVGYWKDAFKVGYSLKKNVEEILKVH